MKNPPTEALREFESTGLSVCQLANNDDLVRAKSIVDREFDSLLASGFFLNEEDKPDAREVRMTSETSFFLSELAWFLESQTYRTIVDLVAQIFEESFDLFMERVIITLPESLLPGPVSTRFYPFENCEHGNLSEFLVPRARRLSIFAHNPWHNDYIDFPDSDADFVSVLIPLSDRSGQRAPLYGCPESFRLKQRFKSDEIEIDEENVSVEFEGVKHHFKRRRLELKFGEFGIWHALNLHAVYPNLDSSPVVNLRLNFCKTSSKDGLLDSGYKREAYRA
jgi:hypothetical protein